MSSQVVRTPTDAVPSRPARAQVDPRGQRFAASITAVVLAIALLTVGSTLSTVLVGVQLVSFAIGALIGPAATPYARAFKLWVRPRLGPPAHTEDAAPPRFAQAVGLGFAVTAFLALLVGATLVATIAIAAALAAAFLNAVFGYCLGCEVYLTARRFAPAR